MTQKNAVLDIGQWVRDNWRQILCDSDATDIYWQMWVAMENSFRRTPKGLAWWALREALFAAGRLALCSITEDDIPHLEQEYAPEGQCMDPYGKVLLRLRATGGYSSKAIFFDAHDDAHKILEGQKTDYLRFECQYEDRNGNTVYVVHVEEDTDYFGAFFEWTIVGGEDSRVCDEKYPAPSPPNGPSPKDGPQIGDCKWATLLIDSVVDAQGVMRGKYRVYPLDAECGQEFCYWETDAGPRFCTNCDSCPEPLVGGDGSCTPQCLSAVTYPQSIPCTWDSETKEFTETYYHEVPEECDLLAIAKRLDAIAYMIEIAGISPYIVCGDKSKLDGSWVSTRWVSDGDSDNSTRRLRKLIRYRSKSDRSADQLRDFWSAFTWEAGSAIVQHKGAWWGTPQVWAESADEGKRILRFAGAEAGIDPDTEGQWIVSDTGHSRYGMSGKMRLAKSRGQYWATRRDSPSGFDL